jgi:hypothetical protein
MMVAVKSRFNFVIAPNFQSQLLKLTGIQKVAQDEIRQIPLFSWR